MSSPGTKKVWDGQGDQQLLLAIIAQQTVSIDWAAVGSRLGVTPRAIQERLKRIKKTLGEEAGSSRVPDKRASNKNSGGTPKKQKTTEEGKGTQVAKKSEDEGGSEVDRDVIHKMQSDDHAEQEEVLNAPAEKKDGPGAS